jgi:hypothetical protein
MSEAIITSLRPKAKDPTGAQRQARFRKKRKAVVTVVSSAPNVSESLAGDCRVADTGRSKSPAAARLRHRKWFLPDSRVTPARRLKARPTPSTDRASHMPVQHVGPFR